MPLRIEDYALIGDTATAALVGNDGSIDWLCLPRFDSPACFTNLLGTPDNGRWLIAPEGEVRRVSRRYRDDTLILETEFETDDGVAVVADFMPTCREEDRHDLVRLVSARRGAVPMRTEIVIRFDYGRIIPWVRRREGGLRAIAGPDALYLRTPVPLIGRDFRTHGRFVAEPGRTVPFLLTWSPSHHPPPVAADPLKLLDKTEAWWRAWTGACRYDGEWREPVRRSLLTLKALTFGPTGGICAAATTSLPEALGGVRNWDYRYCWLRDATFTLLALRASGYEEEALAWREWLLRAVAGTPTQMQVVYGLAGERSLRESRLDWLDGYEGSRPVRIGNAAQGQLQLDVFGEIMDTLHHARERYPQGDEEAWRLQKTLLDFLEGNWRQRDHGLWEVRGPPRNFTHSKVMAWVAVDRSIKSAEKFGLAGPVERWRALARDIRDEVCARAWNPDIDAFGWYYGASVPDASLLLIPLVGFLPCDDARVRGTLAAIERFLLHDGLVVRYVTDPTVDGLPSGEGVFIACTFWYIDNLALAGRHDEARRIFEKLLALRNDVGLLAEEYEPRLGRQLGNFPQAFSHVGLINAVYHLDVAKRAAVRRNEG